MATPANPSGETSFRRYNLRPVVHEAIHLWQDFLYSLAQQHPGRAMEWLEGAVAEEILIHSTPHSTYLTKFVKYVGDRNNIAISCCWHPINGDWPMPGCHWPGKKLDSWIYRQNAAKYSIVCHGNERLLTLNDRLRANGLLLHELWHLIDPRAVVQYGKLPNKQYIASLDPTLEPSAWCFSLTILTQIISARAASGRTMMKNDPTGLDLYPEWPLHKP
jgi:hypothetical protein